MTKLEREKEESDDSADFLQAKVEKLQRKLLGA